MEESKDPIKRKKLFGYLKDNGLTDLDFNTFSQKYSSRENSDKIYSYLSSEKLTDLKPDQFYSEYFGDAKPVKQLKTKQPAQSAQPQVGPQQGAPAFDFDLKKKDTTTSTSGSVVSKWASSPSKTNGSSVSQKPSQTRGIKPLSFQPVEFDPEFIETPVAQKYNNILLNTDKETKDLYYKWTKMRNLSPSERKEVERQTAPLTLSNFEQNLGTMESFGINAKAALTNMFSGTALVNIPRDKQKELDKLNKERTAKGAKEKIERDILQNKFVDFLESLGDNKKADKIRELVLLENEITQNEIFKVNKKVPQVEKQLSQIDKNIESLTVEFKKIEQKINTTPYASKEERQLDIDLANRTYKAVENEINQRNSMASQTQSEINNALELEGGIGTLEQEITLLKKEYEFGDMTRNTLAAGVSEIASNTLYSLERFGVFMSPLGSNGKEVVGEDVKKRALERLQRINEFREQTISPSISLDNVKSVGDLADFAYDAIVQTTPTLIQLSLPGVGIASFAVSQQASYELGIRQRTLDNNIELTNINERLNSQGVDTTETDSLLKRKAQLEAIKAPSEAEILGVSLGLVGVELGLMQLGSIRLLGKLKRAASTVAKVEFKTALSQSFSKRLANGLIGYSKDVAGEAVEESGITLASNISDIFILGEKFNEDGSERNIADGTVESGLSGAIVGSALSGSTSVVGYLAREVADKNARVSVIKNTFELEKLLNQITSVNERTELSDAEKLTITSGFRSRISEINKENAKIINTSFDAYNKMSPVDRKRILDISNQTTAIELTINSLSKKPNTAENQALLDNLKNRENKLNAEKSELLRKSTPSLEITENGNLTRLEGDKDIFERIADDAFIESVSNGTVSVNLSNNPEAIELLNQRVAAFQNRTNETETQVPTETETATQAESTQVQQAIAQVALENDTFFDELETEEEAVTRLEQQIDPEKDRSEEIQRIANEHTQSYLAYLEESGQQEQLQDTDFVNSFQENVVKALSGDIAIEPNQESVQDNGVRVDEQGDPISEQEFLEQTGKVERVVITPARINAKVQEIKSRKPLTRSQAFNQAVQELGGSNPTALNQRTDQIMAEQSRTKSDSDIYRQAIDELSPPRTTPVRPAQRTATQTDAVTETTTETTATPEAEVAQEAVVDAPPVEVATPVIETTQTIETNETQAQGDTTPDGSVQPGTEQVVPTEQESSLQSTTDTTASDATVKEVTDKSVVNPIVRKKYGNEVLNVSLENGVITVENSFNPSKPVTAKNKEKAILDFVNQNNLDTEQYVDAQSYNESSNSGEIAANSTNPVEVARQIKRQESFEQDESSNMDSSVASEFAKQSAIAQVLSMFKFKKVEKVVRGRNKMVYEITDLPQGFKGGSKKTAGLEKITELAQSTLNSNTNRDTSAIDMVSVGSSGNNSVVSVDDVIDFVNQYTSVSDFRDKTKRSSSRDSIEVFDLKEKFRELTGLNPTDKNIQAVINSSQSSTQQNTQLETTQTDQSNPFSFQPLDSDTDSDIPFQTDNQNEIRDPSSVIGRQEVSEQIQLLIPTGLAEDVVVLTDEQVKNFLDDIGVENAQLQGESNGVVITPNGFVYQGVVYINSSKVKKDTLIHEFGHLWTEYMKQNHNEVYLRGLEVVRGTEHHKAVMNNDAYKNLTPEQQLEEALAQAIGEKGSKIVNESKKKAFANWFNVLFKRIAKGLRLSNIDADKLSNLTLDQYTSLASGEILAGLNITGRDTKAIRDSARRNDIVPATSIQTVIQAQQAVDAARLKLIQAFNDKRKTEASIKKALQEYIRANLTKAQATEATKTELSDLVALVSSAKTDINALNAIDKIDAIIESLETKYNARKSELEKSRDKVKQLQKEKTADARQRKKIIQDYLSQVINGKFISEINFNQIKSINNIIENSTNENIDVALQAIDKLAIDLETKYNARKSRNEQKQREARQKIQDRNQSIAEARKAVLDFIKDSFDNKLLGNITLSDFNKIVNKTKFEGRKTGTDSQKRQALQDVLDEITDIKTGLENKTILSKIESILNRKLTQKQSGRTKGNLTTKEQTDFLNGVKRNIKIKDVNVVPLKNSTKNKVSKKIDELATLLSQEQQSASPDLMKMLEISTSIDILSAKISGNAFANSLLNDSLKTITDVYVDGRSRMKDLKEARDLEDSNRNQSITQDVDAPQNKKLSDEALQKEQRKLKGVISRMFFKTFNSTDFLGSLDSLAALLSRSAQESFLDSPFVAFVNKIKLKEISKNILIKSKAKDLNKAFENIFGSVTKADIALGKTHVFNVFRKFEGDANTPIASVEITLSIDEMINVWMNSKNPDLLPGLENNGFTAEVIKEIDSILSAREKDFANFLFNFFDDLHAIESPVYEQVNFYPLTKVPFYAGRVKRVGFKIDSNQDVLKNNNQSTNTTGHASQKDRINNNLPIAAQPATYLAKQAIQQTAHYTAFAEVHREFKKLVSDKNFNDALKRANPLTADIAIKSMREYISLDLEQSGNQGNLVIDFFGRNIASSTLALKLKIGVGQMISITNGIFDMPKSISTAKKIAYTADIIENIKVFRELLQTSDYLKTRYDIGGMENVALGLSDIANNNGFDWFNSTANARINQAARVYNQAMNIALKNVAIGDAIGVFGGVASYRAWLDVYKAQGSEAEAKAKALIKFEPSTDMSQQTISSTGKSQFQKHPYLRYFSMFATAPIQNQLKAMQHFRELVRASKGEGSKGSALRNGLAFFNYQFFQPVMYTYFAQLFAGSLAVALGFGDDEPSEEDKDLLRSTILGNSTAIPFIGGVATMVVDLYVLDKSSTFGSVVSSALLSQLGSLGEDLETMYTTKSAKAEYRAQESVIISSMAMATRTPTFLTDMFLRMDDIYYNDDVTNDVKAWKAFGFSEFTINKAIEKRLSKIEAKAEREKKRLQYERSLSRFNEQGGVDVFDNFLKLKTDSFQPQPPQPPQPPTP